MQQKFDDTVVNGDTAVDADAFDEVAAHVRTVSVEQPTLLLRTFAAHALAA